MSNELAAGMAGQRAMHTALEEQRAMQLGTTPIGTTTVDPQSRLRCAAEIMWPMDESLRDVERVLMNVVQSLAPETVEPPALDNVSQEPCGTLENLEYGQGAIRSTSTRLADLADKIQSLVG